MTFNLPSLVANTAGGGVVFVANTLGKPFVPADPNAAIFDTLHKQVSAPVATVLVIAVREPFRLRSNAG